MTTQVFSRSLLIGAIAILVGVLVMAATILVPDAALG